MKSINPDDSLNKAAISKAYFEGEFWTVITGLEEFRKKGLASASRDDSVYTYKYLSVVYAAEPSTRQKAESFMYLLLKMMPTIDLLDLYISDNIEAIFLKVRSDFDRMQKLKEAEADATRQESMASNAAVNTAASHLDSTRMGTAENTIATVAAPPPGPTTQKAPPGVAPRPSEQRGKLPPWVWTALGGGVVASVTTYFILAYAGSGNSETPTQTWEPQFKPPQQ
jgi:hypothetical protein